jgi:3,4-dihydroxy 2-butanone 4-phosphate synthase/GTP cyclohydrolase II
MQHLALVFGDLGDGHDVLARIQRESVVDAFQGSREGPAAKALACLSREGRGVLIYLREPRVAAPSAPGEPDASDEGHGSAQARRHLWREVGLGAQILKDLGVTSIRLLATHHRHYVGLSGFGIDIASTELL